MTATAYPDAPPVSLLTLYQSENVRLQLENEELRAMLAAPRARKPAAPRKLARKPGRPGWGCWPSCTTDHAAWCAPTGSAIVARLGSDAPLALTEELRPFAVNRNGDTALLPQVTANL